MILDKSWDKSPGTVHKDEDKKNIRIPSVREFIMYFVLYVQKPPYIY